MGISAIPWAEIEAYNNINHKWLTQWDMITLRKMSEAYCRWNNKGGNQKDIADDVPYINRSEEAKEAMRTRVVKSRDGSNNSDNIN